MKHELLQLAFAPTLNEADADRPRQFSGIAYSGGLIPKYGWLGDVAIDLATLTAPTKSVFALINHDADQRAGKVTITNTGQDIQVLGSFLNSHSGRQVAEEFSEGAPWEFSVGLTAEIEEFKTPTLVTVNGQALRLNALLKHASVREVSFVPAGADPHTQAIAFAKPDLFSTLESPMDDELNQMKAQLASVSTLNADLQVKLSALEVDHEQVVADLNSRLLAETEQSKVLFDRANALEAELKAFKADVRLHAVEALFSDLHREFDAESAQVYLNLSDDDYVAIANDLRALKAPTFASSLFQEVAVKTQAESKSEHDFATQLFAQVAGSN